MQPRGAGGGAGAGPIRLRRDDQVAYVPPARLELPCDARECGAVARWRAFLYVPGSRQPLADPVNFPPVLREVRVFIFPLPLYVCDRHKLTAKQVQRVLTERVRASLELSVGDFELRIDQAWIIHETIGRA